MRRCEECGATLHDGRSCRDYFNDLLAHEWDVPGGPGALTHFFAVASYNLQHPSQFSPPMLHELRNTLTEVLAGRMDIPEARARATTGKGQRREPIEGWPTQWPVTVRDVCDTPVDAYQARVRAWAESVSATLDGGGRN